MKHRPLILGSWAILEVRIGGQVSINIYRCKEKECGKYLKRMESYINKG